MIDKKKACPVGGTTEQAAETAAFGEAAISMSHSITTPAKRQVVSERLEIGEANAKPMRELIQILNGDSRTIRLQIERERRGGCPILSGQCGYWICGSLDEAKKFCSSMRHRARQTWATARAVEAAAGLPQGELQQLDGQEALF